MIAVVLFAPESADALIDDVDASAMAAAPIDWVRWPLLETRLLDVEADSPFLRLADFRWLVIPSPTAARFLAAALERAGVRLPSTLGIAVPGPGTAASFRRAFGEGHDLVWPNDPPHDAAKLIDRLAAVDPALAGQSILVVGRRGSRRPWQDELAARAGTVEFAPLFETTPIGPPPTAAARLQQWRANREPVGWIAGSADAIARLAGWLAAVDPAGWGRGRPLFVPHPRLAAKATDLGFGRVLVFDDRDRLARGLQSLAETAPAPAGTDSNPSPDRPPVRPAPSSTPPPSSPPPAELPADSAAAPGAPASGAAASGAAASGVDSAAAGPDGAASAAVDAASGAEPAGDASPSAGPTGAAPTTAGAVVAVGPAIVVVEEVTEVTDTPVDSRAPAIAVANDAGSGPATGPRSAAGEGGVPERSNPSSTPAGSAAPPSPASRPVPIPPPSSSRPPPPPPPPAAPGGAAKGGARSWWPLLLLLVIAGVAFGGWWLMQQRFLQLERDGARRVQDAESRVAQMEQQLKSLQDAQGQITARSGQLEARSGQLEARIARSADQQEQLQALYDELAKSQGDTALAEVEQYVAAAAQYLSLNGNVEAALMSLEAAQARLGDGEGDEAGRIGLRRLVAQDIERLKGLPAVDIAGTAARLDSVIGQVDRLPLLSDASLPRANPGQNLFGPTLTSPATAGATAPASPVPAPGAAAAAAPAQVPGTAVVVEQVTETVPPGAVMPGAPVVGEVVTAAAGATPSTGEAIWARVRGWFDSLWLAVRETFGTARDEFRRVVSIQRIDQADAMLMTPEQREVIRGNLRLLLLNARLELLNRDEGLFRQDLGRAISELERWFDPASPDVKASIATLRALQAVPLTVRMPDLGETLAAIRQARAASESRR